MNIRVNTSLFTTKINIFSITSGDFTKFYNTNTDLNYLFYITRNWFTHN